MISGFDYGSSNCAIGVTGSDNSVELLPLERGQAFIPSTLYAIERELICHAVSKGISDSTLKQQYLALRRNPLNLARGVMSREGIDDNEQSLFVGLDAFDEYQAMIGEGYFIKSPKSFLGASGLRSEFVHFFEDIVCAMMMAIKQRAEKSLQQTLTHTVIGRPVNFQGANAKASNRQALQILSVAAQRAGFKSVEFLYEPLAAGLDFETKLDRDKTVLVVDIGGGTTDCSMVRMGPNHRHHDERSDDFLAHSGERIGGNDLDIQLAGFGLMPLFGMNSMLKSGLPMPTQTFWDAVSTNDIGAQTLFNNQKTTLRLAQWLRDSTEPQLIERLIKLRDDKLNYRLVRSAEEAKIALSETTEHRVDLDYIEQQLNCLISRQTMARAIDRPVSKMTALMDEAINQAGCQPDLIYVTGGSAKSPVIHEAIQRKLGNIEVIDGDHFGSVAAGLTVWAQKIFR